MDRIEKTTVRRLSIRSQQRTPKEFRLMKSPNNFLISETLKKPNFLRDNYSILQVSNGNVVRYKE
jgi:hypothetical protein